MFRTWPTAPARWRAHDQSLALFRSEPRRAIIPAEVPNPAGGARSLAVPEPGLAINPVEVLNPAGGARSLAVPEPGLAINPVEVLNPAGGARSLAGARSILGVIPMRNRGGRFAPEEAVGYNPLVSR